ncbi:MAG: polysaccharide deacetylase family protein [bacterium]|nr:polysaccharide deacetylase family protein [bacterium]
MLLAVNFHYVRPRFDAPFPGIHGVTPGELRRQLALLGRLGEFVAARQVRAAVRGGARLPERAILVTFDDGLREQFEHAWPVLRAMGVPAIFFVNTAPIADGTVSTVHQIHLLRAHLAPGDFVDLLRTRATAVEIPLAPGEPTQETREQYPYDPPETAALKYALNFELPLAERRRLIRECFAAAFGSREAEISRDLYLDADEIRRLTAEAAVGTHVHEHLPLNEVPVSAAEELIRTSLDQLEASTGERPFAMSYPYGGYEACPPAVADRARALGVDFAFTMERAGNPPFVPLRGNASLERPLHLARFDCNDLPGGRNPRFAAEELFDAVPAAGWYRVAATVA